MRMKIWMKVFSIVSIVLAWAQEAVMDGEVDSAEAGRLGGMIIEALGFKIKL